MSTKSVKKIAMISQPMGNLTKEEIGAARVDAVMALNRMGYDAVNLSIHNCYAVWVERFTLKKKLKSCNL